MCRFGKYLSGKVRKISGRVPQYRCIVPTCGEIVCILSSRRVDNCKVDLTSTSGNILLKLDCPNGFERYYLIPSKYLTKQWLITFKLNVKWIVSPENLYLVKQNGIVLYNRNIAFSPKHPLSVLRPIPLDISSATKKWVNAFSEQNRTEQNQKQNLKEHEYTHEGIKRNATSLLIPLMGLVLLFLLRR